MRSAHARATSRLHWQVDVVGNARGYGYRFLVAAAADGAVWVDSGSAATSSEGPPAPPKRKSPSASSGSSAGSSTGARKAPVDGRLVVELFGARQLVKADLIGKSDPYAVLKLGAQTGRTKTINNTLVSPRRIF